ncbi:PROTEIN SEY1 [Salix purpurea]|uniref:PROTEIN SEY1 n=1 Tax=Salix purpurea TaxID=77065 RepID=A0A9Q0WNN4_SALPP|nr:PROTEIN SEY1 [Salix purpurea]
MTKVELLRQWFISRTGLTGDKNEAEPASGFLVCAEKIWKTIKDNKDLDLPALKVMVSTVRCEEIAKEKLRQFTIDDDWLALKGAVQAGPVSRFGATLSSILENYLSQNRLQGSVPASSSSDFTSSAFGMYASNTNLTGLCRISKLKVADFSYSLFTGSIPKCLGYLPRSKCHAAFPHVEATHITCADFQLGTPFLQEQQGIAAGFSYIEPR